MDPVWNEIEEIPENGSGTNTAILPLVFTMKYPAVREPPSFVHINMPPLVAEGMQEAGTAVLLKTIPFTVVQLKDVPEVMYM
jgi:hypothetical protein